MMAALIVPRFIVVLRGSIACAMLICSSVSACVLGRDDSLSGVHFYHRAGHRGLIFSPGS